MDGLHELDYQQAALALGCEVAAIKAVCAIEAPRGGFLETGHPTILFERHVFHRLTDGKYDRAAPNISGREPGAYGTFGGQPARLARAAEFDRAAALMATSWGKFQIMGENYKRAGFKTLQEFINAMFKSEQQHLAAFVSFIKGDQRLVEALRLKNFGTFARLYNGPGYKRNKYDEKMAAAYRSFSHD
jgi:hypothetical protein